jgi:uncharacterized membrane protein YsdA (DUF1294 family)
MGFAGNMNLSRFCYFLLICAGIGSIFTPHPAIAWFSLASLVTLVIYGVDKIAARKAWRRVPEFTLLLSGVVGGWPGAMVGQQLFRHKTQKQPFKRWFIASVIVNILVVGAVYALLPLSHH